MVLLKISWHRLSLTANPEEGGASHSSILMVREASQYETASLEILKENDESELASESASWPGAVDSVLEAPGSSTIKAMPIPTLQACIAMCIQFWYLKQIEP